MCLDDITINVLIIFVMVMLMMASLIKRRAMMKDSLSFDFIHYNNNQIENLLIYNTI